MSEGIDIGAAADYADRLRDAIDRVTVRPSDEADDDPVGTVATCTDCGELHPADELHCDRCTECQHCSERATRCDSCANVECESCGYHGGLTVLCGDCLYERIDAG
jgi:hypothetical protein